jgi:2-phospho-L-lactate guanylyltransferase
MNDTSAVWGILPVKCFATAKSRLAPVLGREARSNLARAMYEDVLATLFECSCLTGMAVVTADSEAAGLAKARGALVIHEEKDTGLNVALRLAIDRLSGNGDMGVVIVPSDLPQLSTQAIATAVEAISRGPSLVIAAARADGGTNLLACRPATAAPLHFGPSSFLQHSRAARLAGLTVSVLDAPELLLDIDTPGDLEAFHALHTNTRTHAFVAREVFGSAQARSRVAQKDDRNSAKVRS